ncbi:adenosine deaminase 2-A-like [Nymphalis io]|uniref:adenosine deaminase 2-A-like n=1 Tax=Inachis io TaxID=171585 RepID=UPI002167C668|nr:adenosine deaminase 2-A-like [Nymphalis io]
MRFVISYVFVFTVCYATIDDYKAKRAKILRDEGLLSVGGSIQLTDKESTVNNCIMQHKFREVDYGFNNPQYYKFSRHFFTYKDDICLSKVYQIIKDMPKGAALHIHDMGILGPDYIMNLTYSDELYICFDKNNVKFKFSDKTPKTPCKSNWQLINEARKSSNSTKFDMKLRKYFTLRVSNPDASYPSIKESWEVFMKYFGRVIGILTYRPIWEQYFYDVLLKFKNDNVMYLEVRSVLPNLYELDGTLYAPLITAKTYRKTIEKFKKDHPDFIGAKLIYAPSRSVNRSQMDEYLRLAKAIKADVPDIFAGFDLVGQEDLGSPLIEFIPQLTAASKDLNYFFHAGETDWYGTLTDENLIDAILLGAKRIGHAYALSKHPLLMKEVIDKGIALEVNVISNTVLSLVRDVRNHPLSNFFAQGMPVVLSSDDPGAWEADPLSDDFYVAFVGVASRLSDLRLLKQLAINSLTYSTLDADEKEKALDNFSLKWNTFVDNFNCSKY